MLLRRAHLPRQPKLNRTAASRRGGYARGPAARCLRVGGDLVHFLFPAGRVLLHNEVSLRSDWLPAPQRSSERASQGTPCIIIARERKVVII